MSLLDEITQGFTNAIDNIRHSVVEQGWFGQETTGDISGSSDISAPEAEATSIEPPEAQEEEIMEMFTPPAEVEQELGQGQEVEGMDI